MKVFSSNAFQLLYLLSGRYTAGVFAKAEIGGIAPTKTIYVGTDVVLIDATRIIVESQTLRPGASPLTIGGRVFSENSRHHLIVEGKAATHTFSAPDAGSASSAPSVSALSPSTSQTQVQSHDSKSSKSSGTSTDSVIKVVSGTGTITSLTAASVTESEPSKGVVTSSSTATGATVPGSTSTASRTLTASNVATSVASLVSAYAKDSKAWASSINDQGVRGQALNETKAFKDNITDAYTALGGKLPPDSICGSDKSGDGTISAQIAKVGTDLLSQLGCAIAIATALVTQLSVPLGAAPDIGPITAGIAGLGTLGEDLGPDGNEHEGDHQPDDPESKPSATKPSATQSTATSTKSTPSSTPSSSSTSSSSSSSSASRSSSSRSSVSLSLPPIQTDGIADELTAKVPAAEASSIHSVVSAAFAVQNTGVSSGLSTSFMSTSTPASANPSDTAQHSITPPPSSKSPLPTLLPSCAEVVWKPADTECPYASGLNYCNCSGTAVAPLPAPGSAINCKYTTQPKANACPVNTAYSQSLASASSAAAASAAEASIQATQFNPSKTITSCGQTYGTAGATRTAVPWQDSNVVESGIAHFCTPDDGPLVLEKAKPAIQNFGLPPDIKAVYQISLEWDSRPECANAAAPSIVATDSKGPDPVCNARFLGLLNGCDNAGGQDKHGGRLYAGCAIYEWSVLVPPDGFGPVLPWHQPTSVSYSVILYKRASKTQHLSLPTQS